MPTPHRLQDNTQYEPGQADDPGVAALLSTDLASEIAGRSLGDVASRGSVLVFPPTLGDSEDLDESQVILERVGDGVRTGNVMGVIGMGDDELTICSRFSKDDKDDYFLSHMLQRVFAPNVVDLRISFGMRESYFDLLPLLFPEYLTRAVSRGVLRAYVRREHDDPHFRGSLDVGRFIAHDIPFMGSVAYSTREYDSDNPVTELVRHTIEHLGASPLGRLLSKTPEVVDAVSAVRSATPRYSRGDRRRVIEANRKAPVRHRYYSGYLELQRLCLAILTHRWVSLREDSGRVHGILFDGAWLWEEYVNTLIGERFFHPRNRAKEGVQHLFNGENGPIYPDFISLDDSPRVIADAKYKRSEGVHGDDYLQILAYMYRFDSSLGLFLHPASCESGSSKDLFLLQGANIPEKTKEGRRGEPAPRVRKIGLGIPDGGARSYQDFRSQMEERERAFVKQVDESLLQAPTST